MDTESNKNKILAITTYPSVQVITLKDGLSWVVVAQSKEATAGLGGSNFALDRTQGVEVAPNQPCWQRKLPGNMSRDLRNVSRVSVSS